MSTSRNIYDRIINDKIKNKSVDVDPFVFWAYSDLWNKNPSESNRPTENLAINNVYKDALFMGILRYDKRRTRRTS